MTDQHPPSEDDSAGGGVIYDHERAYGQRIPSSYDVDAAANLLAAEVAYIEANGGKGVLNSDDVDLVLGVVRAWAGQFRKAQEGSA